MFDMLLYNPRLSLTVSNRRGFNYLQFAVLKGYKRYVREYCSRVRYEGKKKIIEVMPSSETQGLLAGTMRYFRASDIFRRKFTLSAEEPLGTYSYRTSSRSGRIPLR